MNRKISELPSADNLDGSELLPVVQGPDTAKATVIALANFVASNPPGMSPFPTLKFGNCEFNPNNDESICLNVGSTISSAIVFQCAVEDDAPQPAGMFGARTESGLFAYSFNGSYPFTLENCNGITINGVHLMDDLGNLLDNGGNIVFNRAAGRQGPIANATGAGDVVAAVNNILATLRTLKLIS